MTNIYFFYILQFLGIILHHQLTFFMIFTTNITLMLQSVKYRTIRNYFFIQKSDVYKKNLLGIDL